MFQNIPLWDKFSHLCFKLIKKIISKSRLITEYSISAVHNNCSPDLDLWWNERMIHTWRGCGFCLHSTTGGARAAAAKPAVLLYELGVAIAILVHPLRAQTGGAVSVDAVTSCPDRWARTRSESFHVKKRKILLFVIYLNSIERQTGNYIIWLCKFEVLLLRKIVKSISLIYSIHYVWPFDTHLVHTEAVTHRTYFLGKSGTLIPAVCSWRYNCNRSRCSLRNIRSSVRWCWRMIVRSVVHRCLDMQLLK